MILPQLMHYGAASLAVLLGASGTGIGQGIAGAGALAAMERQPLGSDQSFRGMVIGLALIESGGIFSLIISLLLLTTSPAEITIGVALAELGIAIAIGVSACVVGIASGFAVYSSCLAMVRQPFFSQKIITLMLLTQSIIEAPVIFSFVIALLIKIIITDTTSFYEGIKLLSAGLIAALGCIGPSIGQALFAKSSCEALGLNTDSYKRILPFSLVSEAIIETPVIFSILLSFLFIFFHVPSTALILSIFAFLAAAVAMGLGALGTGIASGYVASKGCREIALDPKNYPAILRATLVSQAIIEASVIYAFIIALLLITRLR